MVNNYAKMRRTQAKAKAYLESKGWKVWLIQHTRFQKDIWNLFDGISLHQNERTMAFLQIKSGRLPNLKPYKLFLKRYPFVKIILLAWVDRKGWKEVILTLNQLNWTSPREVYNQIDYLKEVKNEKWKD